jgi:hypothetical protein
MCSWDTTEHDVDEFAQAVHDVMAQSVPPPYSRVGESRDPRFLRPHDCRNRSSGFAAGTIAAARAGPTSVPCSRRAPSR